MTNEKEMTAPVVSVGADTEQSSQNLTDHSMYRLCASSLGERKQHLLMATGCQKCFCVTLDKSNRTPAAAGG